MRKVIWLIATQFVMLSLAVFADNANGYFHRVGQEVIAPSGKPYLIKGVNVSCWLYQENYVLGGAQTAQKVTSAKLKRLLGEEGYLNYIKNMMANFLTPADLEHMKKMGINSVRLGFDAELWEKEETRQLFYNTIDQLLPAFKANEIAILLIMMVPPKAPDKLWCTGYVKGDTMLWDSPHGIQRTVDIWKDIAAHYSKEASILGYDLLGEPLLPKNRANELISVYKQISTAIRSVDPNHMIVYEGNNYALDIDVLGKNDDALDANAAYSYHFYSWFGLKMKNYMPKFMRNARTHNRPIFCGEWGINRLSTMTSQVNIMNSTTDMDGWFVYMWKALELPLGKEEKKRPPYYGNWFFIPFSDLYMSLITFKLDNETRDFVDWMSDVKNARTPDAATATRILNHIVATVKWENCKENLALMNILGFKPSK